jgi:outer membrane protein assembly factor BamB
LGAGTARAQLKAGPGDWPGWRGPDRTDVSTETGLLKEWPEGGPPLIWKATGLGNGFSTPSIYNGRIYLIGGKGSEESVVCLDVKDGKQVWSSKIGAQARVSYVGTRSTPTIDGELLYALSSAGDLACLETASGKVKWTKSYKSDFGGQYHNWGYTESPLVDGDLLICTPGGSKATLVALNKKTGDEVWRTSLSDRTAAYSSPIVAEVGGLKQYVQYLPSGVVGVSAKDGKLLWRYAKSAAPRGANISTPIFADGYVFSAAAYNTGGGLVQLTVEGDKVTAKEVFFSKDMMNHHGGVVKVGDALYGTGTSTLLCLDFKTGKKMWQERSVGKGAVTYADGHLYVRGENGAVALVEATPSGYKEKGRFSQPDRSRQKAWPHPVVAGGRLYLRDQDVLLCYDVKQK